MTSPLPPRRRDSRNLADLIRQHKQNLKQVGVGFVDGRFSPARPLGRPVLDGDEDDTEGDELAFINTDRAAASAAGQIILNLTYEPVDGSLHIRWNGLDQPPTDWVLAGQRVTFSEPHVHAGDVLTAAYAYYPNDIGDPPPPAYRPTVLSFSPVGFWNFEGNYADDSGHGYTLTGSSSNVFTATQILSEPSNQGLDLGAIAAYTFSGTPVPAVDAIAGTFSVVWAGADGNITNHGYGNIVAQANLGDHHFRVQHDALTSPPEIVVEWHDGTTNCTHHLPLPAAPIGQHFWGVTVGATTVSAYVDGILISQVPKVSAPVAQAAGHYVCVGTDGATNQRWQGQIDGVALFSGALTDANQLLIAQSAGYGL